MNITILITHFAGEQRKDFMTENIALEKLL